uniref:NADH dehydrogenase subunit 4L n=1 Tax=Dactylogyrus simplex TaxID=2736736 RepID=UPI002E75F5C6|nr:NADH dehydrogenase subunit 4L [Dactylogyrus simplex]WPS93115.1 NADH dehydrogenase subunit 4L [Dactylogyrus simplex]
MSTVLFGLVLISGVFSLVTFKFISVILLIENANILILLFCYLGAESSSRAAFLVFMVVATIEVTLALVSLTRLWDYDSLSY